MSYFYSRNYAKGSPSQIFEKMRLWSQMANIETIEFELRNLEEYERILLVESRKILFNNQELQKISFEAVKERIKLKMRALSILPTSETLMNFPKFTQNFKSDLTILLKLIHELPFRKIMNYLDLKNNRRALLELIESHVLIQDLSGENYDSLRERIQSLFIYREQTQEIIDSFMTIVNQNCYKLPKEENNY